MVGGRLENLILADDKQAIRWGVVTPNEQRARELHPAGTDLRDVTFDAPGVDEVGIATWPILYRLRARLTGGTRVSNRWAVLAVVLAGLFTVSVTITLLAVSIVDIAGDFDSTTSTIGWVITAPMLAFGVVGPAAGKAGDMFGHKRLFLIGLLGAAVFAALTALAWDPLSLILFRTLSASFGSAAGPAAIAIINRIFAEDERVKALGYWSLVSAGAPVVGVVVGGPLVEAIGWRAIFAVQAPLCLAGMLVALVLLPETERSRGERFDWAGASLLGLGVTSLLLAVNRGGTWGWTSPGVLLGFAITPVVLVAFVAVERRAAAPLLPLAWVRRRNVVGPMGSQALTNFAYMGGFILTPLLLEEGLGMATSVVGLLIIARPLAFAVTAPTASRATMRVGERVAGIAGATAVVASMVLLAAVGEGTSYAFIALALALSGVGLGIQSPAMGATVANAVDEEDLGVAGALQQLVSQVGAVIGVQVMQSVQEAVAGDGEIASYGTAYLVGAAVAALGIACAAVIRPTMGSGTALERIDEPVPVAAPLSR
jgi:EmrB/QacA subfamily drug resistance transporter